MRTEQIPTLAAFWNRRLFSSRHGILFLVFFALFHALTALWMVMLADNLSEKAGLVDLEDMSFVYDMLASGVALDSQTVKDVLTSHPPLLLALYSLAIFALPWLCIFGTFDQMASDISSRHSRFLLIRSDRATLFVGNAVGALGFIALCEAVGLGVLAATLLGKGALGGVEGVLYLLRMWVCLVVYSVPFVGLTAATSVLTGRPLWSLACSLGFWFAVVCAAFIGGLIDDSAANLSYLIPTELKYYLISDSFSDLGTVLAHLAALSGLYFGVGYLVLRRRNV
jgi:hypothetical protein